MGRRSSAIDLERDPVASDVLPLLLMWCSRRRAIRPSRSSAERAPFKDIVARCLNAMGDPHEVVPTPRRDTGAAGSRSARSRQLDEAGLGRIGMDEWLRRRSQGAA